MKIFRSYKERGLPRHMILGIGNFDGVHLGHQKIIAEVIERAEKGSCPSGLLTFDPHPMAVIDKGRAPLPIYTREEKLSLLKETGLALVICQKFDRSFASLTPEDFLKKIIVEHLDPQGLVVGEDFRYGRGGAGDVGLLKQKSREYGYFVSAVKELTIGGRPVKSSHIRRLIAAGAVQEAARLLGRPYHLSGKVLSGGGYGKKVGFPTANIIPPAKLIPPDGVYAARVIAGGAVFPGAVNIGIPMRRGKKRYVECHFLDFDGELYGQIIEVRFIKKIRDEMTLTDYNDLAAQLKNDISSVRKVLAGSLS